MRILMTGATGLVGQKLGIKLTQKGYDLTVVTRRRSTADTQCPFPCSVIEADLSRTPLDLSDHPPFDGVINLMGEPIADGFWTAQKKERLRTSRVAATENLVKSFAAKPPRFVLSASAIGIYGDQGDSELSESSSLGTDFLAKLCQDWESAALAFKSPQTRVIIPRIGLVLDRQGGLLGELEPLFRAGLGGPLGSGDQWMSPIHIDDLIQSFLFAIENETIQGSFNAVGPASLRNKDFTRELAKILHRPAFVPAPRLALSLAFQEKASLLLNSQRVLPSHLLKWGFQFKAKTFSEGLAIEFPAQERHEDVFQSYQYIPRPPAELFPFFADANNLETITPPNLNFKILSVTTPNIQQGTLIDYSLRLHGFPIHWRTLIDCWAPPHQFVDQQLKGPYSLWHHTHSFEPLGSGTLMTDRVRFKLPLGFIGWLFGHHLVRKEVAGIFAFRHQKIRQLFPS